MTLWTAARQAYLSIGFSRQGHWSGLPFPLPEDLPDPGIKLKSPALQTDSFTIWATREALQRVDKSQMDKFHTVHGNHHITPERSLRRSNLQLFRIPAEEILSLERGYPRNSQRRRARFLVTIIFPSAAIPAVIFLVAISYDWGKKMWEETCESVCVCVYAHAHAHTICWNSVDMFKEEEIAPKD